MNTGTNTNKGINQLNPRHPRHAEFMREIEDESITLTRLAEESHHFPEYFRLTVWDDNDPELMESYDSEWLTLDEALFEMQAYADEHPTLEVIIDTSPDDSEERVWTTGEIVWFPVSLPHDEHPL